MTEAVDHDVVIVGAGPAGSALATRLVDTGRSVALLESGRFGKPRIGESLTPAVRPLLTELGLWSEIAATGPLPSWGTRSIWSDPEPEMHSHLSSPYRQGWHVDRRAFDHTLALAARRRGAALCCGTRLRRAVFVSGQWELTVAEDGLGDRPAGDRVVTAGVLVDASGRSGRVARMLDAQRIVFDHLVGLGRVWSENQATGNGAADHCVLVEATADGWWYSAPLPDGGLITLLMTDADIGRRRGLGREDVWRTALAETTATRARVGARCGDSRIRSHAAGSARTVRRPDDTRPWLAVGDAALAVDPLTGSGVNRALRTAADAAPVVDDMLASGRAGTTRAADIVGRYEHDGNVECHRYLHERLGFYAAGPHIESPFWAKRRRVAAQVAADRRRHSI